MAKIPITIEVEKPVTKFDVIMSLMEEGELAWKGKKGTFLFNLKKMFKNKPDYKLLKAITWDIIRSELNEKKD